MSPVTSANTNFPPFCVAPPWSSPRSSMVIMTPHTWRQNPDQTLGRPAHSHITRNLTIVHEGGGGKSGVEVRSGPGFPKASQIILKQNPTQTKPLFYALQTPTLHFLPVLGVHRTPSPLFTCLWMSVLILWGEVWLFILSRVHPQEKLHEWGCSSLLLSFKTFLLRKLLKIIPNKPQISRSFLLIG